MVEQKSIPYLTILKNLFQNLQTYRLLSNHKRRKRNVLQIIFNCFEYAVVEISYKIMC